MVPSALPKKSRIHCGMVRCNYFREIKKHCTLKKMSPAINYVNQQGKKLGATAPLWITSFLMSLFFLFH